LVSAEEGDVQLWNVIKSKILEIAIAHIRAATKREYAAIV